MEASIYLSFNGNAEEAMNFYVEKLGGTVGFVQRFGDSPVQSSEGYKNKIMHASIHLGNLLVMFSDGMEDRKVAFGDNFSISIDCKSDGEARKWYDAISEGGVVTMPLQDTFWGALFGMCTDKFGVNWMFNYDKPKP